MDSELLLNLEKSEYTLFISCGLLAGLIDTIFVGDPQHSMLEGVVDKGADQFVVKAAGFFYDHDNRKTNNEGYDYSEYSVESKKVIASAASIAVTIKSIIDTPILNDDGSLTDTSTNIMDEIVKNIDDRVRQ